MDRRPFKILSPYKPPQSFVDMIQTLKANSQTIVTERVIYAHSCIDMLRSEFVYNLRCYYKFLCGEYLDIADPKESFNRWIMDRHLYYPYGVDGYCDPILPFAVDTLCKLHV